MTHDETPAPVGPAPRSWTRPVSQPTQGWQPRPHPARRWQPDAPLLPDPVIVPLRPRAAALVVLGVVAALFGLLPLGSTVVTAASGDLSDIGGGGGLAVRLVITLFLTAATVGPFVMLLRSWGSYVAVGSQGIWRHTPHRDQGISWREVGLVGISMLSTTTRTGTKTLARIRIAPSVPGLPTRPDLARWRTGDEPEPYTLKLPIPFGGISAAGTARIEMVAAALVTYGGGRFSGVDHREPFVRRYS